MRRSILCAIAFAANNAVASVCKPRSRTPDLSTLLLSTSATYLQDATTTLLAVPSASTSESIFSDTTFTSLSKTVATTSDLTIDTTSGQTGLATKTTLSFESHEITIIIDTTTTGLSTAIAGTATSEVNTNILTSTTDTAIVELSSTTLEEAESTVVSVDMDTTVMKDVTTTGTDATTTDPSTADREATSISVTTTSADSTTPTTLETVTFSVTTTATDIPTTEVASTGEATTSIADSTTTTDQGPFQPLPTFELVGISSPMNGVNGQRLANFESWIGWNHGPSATALHFTIEPETGYLKTSESHYICVYTLSTDVTYNGVYICDETSHPGQFKRISCEQESDGKLACSIPAVSCALNIDLWDIECTEVGGDFNKFYTWSVYSGDYLYFGLEDEPPLGDEDEVNPVELGIVAPMPVSG